MVAGTTVYGREILDVLDQRELKRNRYILKASGLDAVVINMPFGQSTIISTANKSKLKGATIYQVDVVYTDFPKGVDLTELNKQRILKTLELRSDLLKDESIKWSMIRQMDCKSEAEAQTLFHGIVIHFRPQQDENLFKTERIYYDSILPKERGEAVTNAVFKNFRDSSVVASFRRNKWKDATIVTDATGSMSPYIGQFLLWHYLKLDGVQACNITFFNDGNRKESSVKLIGSTGGIYTEKISDYTSLLKLLKLTTANGNGGDVEENGVEAILRAQKEYPTAKEIVYIADNYAPLRDFSLIDQIKIPVRVVVCGAGLGINAQLMTIAYSTKGSIHTMEKDVRDFPNYKEGAVVSILGNNYKMTDGQLKPVAK